MTNTLSGSLPDEILSIIGYSSGIEQSNDLLDTVEAQRGRKEYATMLGKTEQELDVLLAGKNVLDLGAGAAIFAIETELKALTDG